MIYYYIFMSVCGLFLVWHLYIGACMIGWVKFRYRVAVLENGIYQSQYLNTFGWTPIWYYKSDHGDELDAQAAIALDIEKYRKKKQLRIEKRKTYKVKRVIPFMGDKKYPEWNDKNGN